MLMFFAFFSPCIFSYFYDMLNFLTIHMLCIFFFFFELCQTSFSACFSNLLACFFLLLVAIFNCTNLVTLLFHVIVLVVYTVSDDYSSSSCFLYLGCLVLLCVDTDRIWFLLILGLFFLDFLL